MDLRKVLIEANRGQISSDRSELIEGWQEAIDDLFDDITKRYLADYISDKLISVQRKFVMRSEKRLGSYDINELVLTAGANVIKLTPISRFVVDYDGRVDFHREGSAGRSYALLNKFSRGGNARWWIAAARELTRAQLLSKKRFQDALADIIRWI
jgi:hypothetical protein